MTSGPRLSNLVTAALVGAVAGVACLASGPMPDVAVVDLPGTVAVTGPSADDAAPPRLTIYRSGTHVSVVLPEPARAFALARPGDRVSALLRGSDGRISLWTYEVASGRTRVTDLDVPDPTGLAVSASAAGNAFLMPAREGQLSRIDEGGTVERAPVPEDHWRLSSDTAEALYAAAWRGDEVTFFRGRGRLPTRNAQAWSWKRGQPPVSTGATLSLAGPPLIAWAHEGSALAYTGLKDGTSMTVVRVRADGQDSVVFEPSELRGPDGDQLAQMDVYSLGWNADGTALAIAGRGLGTPRLYFVAMVALSGAHAIYVGPSFCYIRDAVWVAGSVVASCSAAGPNNKSEAIVIDPDTGAPRQTFEIAVKADPVAASDDLGFAIYGASGDLLLVSAADPLRRVPLVRAGLVGWCCP